MDRKASSLASHPELDKDIEELLHGVTRRTAIIFRGFDVLVQAVEGQSSRISFEGSGEISAAVPVTRDGYFLTASHVVKTGQPLSLVAWVEDEERLQQAVPRVVWSGEGSAARPDIALLHADMGKIGRFAMADWPDADAFVVVTGSSAVALIGMRLDKASDLAKYHGTAMGRVLSVSPVRGTDRGHAHRMIRHDAPTIRGDSGGALIDLRGNLIGINATVHPPRRLAWLPYLGVPPIALLGVSGSYSRAVRPEGDWLDDLIEEDRKRRSRAQRRSGVHVQ